MDERLQEIKAVFKQWCSGKGGGLDKDDIEWLINQAERQDIALRAVLEQLLNG